MNVLLAVPADTEDYVNQAGNQYNERNNQKDAEDCCRVLPKAAVVAIQSWITLPCGITAISNVGHYAKLPKLFF